MWFEFLWIRQLSIKIWGFVSFVITFSTERNKKLSFIFMTLDEMQQKMDMYTRPLILADFTGALTRSFKKFQKCNPHVDFTETLVGVVP